LFFIYIIEIKYSTKVVVMKKIKRFAALICAILLFLMYVSTLVFAFIDKSRSLGLLKASVACTILVPVMSYAYILVYRLIHRNDDDFHSEY
jgi:hypothetical protein